MIKLPMDYEQASSFEGNGGRRLLPAGGYICQIKDAKETHTADGRPMVEIYLDIFEGEYKDFYTAQYSAAIRKGYNPKWRCIYRQPIIKKDKMTNPRFKGMITAIQDSNPNAALIVQGQLNVDLMKNCLVGVLFKEEHSVWQGREMIKAVPDGLINVSKVRNGEFNTPSPRLLTEEEKDQLIVAQGFTQDAGSGLPF